MTKAGPVFSGYQAGPGGAAVWCSYIALGEACSLLGDTVDMWSGYFFITLTTELPIAQIIRKKDDQVRHLGNPFTCERAGRCKKN